MGYPLDVNDAEHLAFRAKVQELVDQALEVIELDSVDLTEREHAHDAA